VTAQPSLAASKEAGLLERVGRVVSTELKPLVRRIDQGHYPEVVLRRLGEAGAYSAHAGPEPRLFEAVQAMARAGQECLSTAFCAWCQDTFVWYLRNTENDELKRRLLDGASGGRILGGTGLSNPMKAEAGIEPLRLSGRRVPEGFIVNGTLPWVSNLGPTHFFGTSFDLPEEGRQVAFIADCSSEGLRLRDGARFLALDGTATCSVSFRDVLVPRSMVLAEPAAPFIGRIKAGFILLQTGMGLGLIRGCVEVMRKADESGEHLNRYLPDRPELFEETLRQLTGEIALLCATPFETSRDYLRRVLQARLEISDWSLRAAQAAMLHAGAKGYLESAAAQRKLRESVFIAIVTPATKHLRKELAGLAGWGRSPGRSQDR
jgi:alkylation response protein AidB-like acyl-CoA dehydrogenase